MWLVCRLAFIVWLQLSGLAGPLILSTQNKPRPVMTSQILCSYGQWWPTRPAMASQDLPGPVQPWPVTPMACTSRFRTHRDTRGLQSQCNLACTNHCMSLEVIHGQQPVQTSTSRAMVAETLASSGWPWLELDGCGWPWLLWDGPNWPLNDWPLQDIATWLAIVGQVWTWLDHESHHTDKPVQTSAPRQYMVACKPSHHLLW